MKHRRLFEAALSKFKGQKEEARALLEVYLNDSVGVGEHATLVDDIMELTKKLTEAEDCISTLRAIEHYEGGHNHGNRDSHSK